MTQRILITGGKGFIGSALAAGAFEKGFTVRATSRKNLFEEKKQLENSLVEELGPGTDWLGALKGVNIVVHCAGRAHVMDDGAAGSLNLYRTANVKGTLNLARQAVDAGISRFVFLSSIGVHGSQTSINQAFSEADKPSPHNAYALSKLEAEQGLWRIVHETGVEVVVIRPTLVYGAGAPGNFGALMRAVQRGCPLPLGAVHNQRSLVALDNLVDFIVTCISHPQAANQTFLVSDGQDLSTTELVRGMAQAAGVPARLLPVPVWALQAGASLLGKGDAVQRLCGNLQVDISKARSLLGWVPPVSVQEGLRRAMAI